MSDYRVSSAKMSCAFRLWIQVGQLELDFQQEQEFLPYLMDARGSLPCVILHCVNGNISLPLLPAAIYILRMNALTEMA
jgi:hypothetical protein